MRLGASVLVSVGLLATCDGLASYTTPARIKSTANYREATELSQKFLQNQASGPKKAKVAIVGGGLSGVSVERGRAAPGGTAPRAGLL